jgi:hypothetical protein
MPIERLAQLLLQHAQADTALPRRPPANDDAQHATFVDDMFNRIEGLPELRRESEAMRREPYVSPPVLPAAEVASNEDLEELVSIALASAQDAEDVSREAAEASRKARRGMFVAVGVAALGIVIATAGTISARLFSADTSQMADIAKQVQALGDLQHHIDGQLAEMHAAPPVQEASASPVAPAQPGSAEPPPLAPLKATPVRVLPAEATPPQPAPAATDPSPGTEASAASYAPASSYDTYQPPAPSRGTYAPYVVYRAGTPYHPRVRRYRAAVVWPRPMAYFIGTVRRDVRTLFR